MASHGWNCTHFQQVVTVGMRNTHEEKKQIVEPMARSGRVVIVSFLCIKCECARKRMRQLG